MPKIPMRMGGYDFGLRYNPPDIGQHGKGVMATLGYSEDEIEELIEKEIIVVKD